MTHEKYYKEHNHHVQIRISGDGARYSRTSSYCLLSFGFIRENQCSLSPVGKKNKKANNCEMYHKQNSLYRFMHASNDQGE